MFCRTKYPLPRFCTVKQGIDIGHLDLEYEWYQIGAGGPANVPYKYNNEFPGGRETLDFLDMQYEQEILQRFL